MSQRNLTVLTLVIIFCFCLALIANTEKEDDDHWIFTYGSCNICGNCFELYRVNDLTGTRQFIDLDAYVFFRVTGVMMCSECRQRLGDKRLKDIQKLLMVLHPRTDEVMIDDHCCICKRPLLLHTFDSLAIRDAVEIGGYIFCRDCGQKIQKWLEDYIDIQSQRYQEEIRNATNTK